MKERLSQEHRSQIYSRNLVVTWVGSWVGGSPPARDSEETDARRRSLRPSPYRRETNLKPLVSDSNPSITWRCGEEVISSDDISPDEKEHSRARQPRNALSPPNVQVYFCSVSKDALRSRGWMLFDHLVLSCLHLRQGRKKEETERKRRYFGMRKREKKERETWILFCLRDSIFFLLRVLLQLRWLRPFAFACSQRGR